MAQLELKKRDNIGDWQLERLLGSGGQGHVWAVRYLKDKHSAPGALKICLDPTDKARTRFMQEVDLLRSHTHEGIVRVRDVGEHLDFPFFVMERANTTLQDVAAAQTTGTRLICESRELLFRFLRQACTAVAHLHSKGVLHRDLKPSNVLLMLNPPEPTRAVLADFGIASVEADQGKLTATHESIGTPSFRAPEALTGHHTTRSDVYSMGKTIEAVINRTTTLGMGPGKCLRDTSLTDDFWDALDAVLENACNFDPNQRYEDAQTLLEALPVPVLGQGTAGSKRIKSPKVTIVLNVSARVTLFEIIGECLTPKEYAPLYRLNHQSCLSNYQ